MFNIICFLKPNPMRIIAIEDSKQLRDWDPFSFTKAVKILLSSVT